MKEPKEQIRLFLESTIKELVDMPELASVRINQGERTTVFLIRTARLDVGKIIGRQGRIADAIRLLLNSIAMKYGIRCIMEIGENATQS